MLARLSQLLSHTAPHSLRRRLLVMLLVTTSILWLLIALAGYYLVHHEADQVFDAQLSEVAQTLQAITHRSGGHVEVGELGHFVHPYQQRFLYQVWSRDAQGWHLWMRSENAPTTMIPVVAGFSDWQRPLAAQRTPRPQPDWWRSYCDIDQEDGFRVIVAQSHSVRDELAEQLAWRLLWPLLIGLPLLGVMLWLIVGQALRPLESIAAEVREHHPRSLEPLTRLPALPEEVEPLVTALNGLFSRVRTAMDNERHFTADAAHELRTPLAALKVQAQVAQRASEAHVRQQALQQLQGGVERMTHLVEQLLTLARVDPERDTLGLNPVDLGEIAAEVCAEQTPLALEQGRELSVVGEPALHVQGNAGLLYTLLRNLIDNAMRYTPPGSPIEVHLGPHSLAVVDHGPGIPAEERARVLQRFHRLPGSGTGGSGLGLSIVERIAELHGARLALSETDGGGLTITLRFLG